jgi:hypothetical protein
MPPSSEVEQEGVVIMLELGPFTCFPLLGRESPNAVTIEDLKESYCWFLVTAFLKSFHFEAVQ